MITKSNEMRILDNDADVKLDAISLFLTKTEALHLIGYLEQLVESTGIPAKDKTTPRIHCRVFNAEAERRGDAENGSKIKQ